MERDGSVLVCDHQPQRAVVSLAYIEEYWECDKNARHSQSVQNKDGKKPWNSMQAVEISALVKMLPFTLRGLPEIPRA